MTDTATRALARHARHAPWRSLRSTAILPGGSALSGDALASVADARPRRRHRLAEDDVARLRRLALTAADLLEQSARLFPASDAVDLDSRVIDAHLIREEAARWS